MSIEDRDPNKKMTLDEFLTWSRTWTDGERYELINGFPVRMAAERIVHVAVKANVWLALRDAIRDRGLECQAYGDGLTVPRDAYTGFEPDALVRCGEPLDGASKTVPDPLIVVEVRSLSTASVDAGVKFSGYFNVPSIVHYLIVDTDAQLVIHHRRGAHGVSSSIVPSGQALDLEPPGIQVEVARFFDDP